MSSELAVLILIQWAVMISLAVLLLGVTRQVGVLHRRLGPAGALMTSVGPVIGDKIPEFDLETLTGGEVQIGGNRADGRSTLIAFVAPDCPVCSSLVPVYKFIARSERERLRIVFASDAAVKGHAAYRRKMGIDDHPYVLSTELGLRFEIGKLPYAVLIDAQGVLVSQGLVNTREHIESLLEAQRLNIGSIQEFFEPDRAIEGRSAHA